MPRSQAKAYISHFSHSHATRILSSDSLQTTPLPRTFTIRTKSKLSHIFLLFLSVCANVFQDLSIVLGFHLNRCLCFLWSSAFSMAGAENKVCLGNAAKRTVLYNVTNLPNGEGVLSQGETAEEATGIYEELLSSPNTSIQNEAVVTSTNHASKHPSGNCLHCHTKRVAHSEHNKHYRLETKDGIIGMRNLLYTYNRNTIRHSSFQLRKCFTPNITSLCMFRNCLENERCKTWTILSRRLLNFWFWNLNLRRL